VTRGQRPQTRPPLHLHEKELVYSIEHVTGNLVQPSEIEYDPYYTFHERR
jgi:hypothetical protein